MEVGGGQGLLHRRRNYRDGVRKGIYKYLGEERKAARDICSVREI